MIKFNRRVVSKALAIVLSTSIIVTISAPLLALGASVGYSNQLGTNAALGSPLLNDNFNYDDWNKWEMLTFGVFLSNFTEPLVDSYGTAFSVNTQGSAGAGKKALQFGSGSDSAGNKALNSMLSYAVTAQKSGYKEIKAKYSTRSKGSAPADAGTKEATIMDMFISTSGSTGNTVSFGTSSVGGYEVNVPSSSKLCQLVVSGDSEDQDEIIFDWTNGWDIQMMSAWVARATKSQYASKACDNLSRMISENSKLVMDTFGNICVVLDGEPIVVFPAAANCHIYRNNKYNLLNSLVLSSAYCDAPADSIVNNLSSKSGSKSGSLEAHGTVENGDLLVYFDSEYNIADYARKALSGDGNSSSLGSANLNYGRELTKLLNSTLTGSTKSNELGFRLSVVGADDWVGVIPWNDSKLEKMSQELAKCTGLLGGYYGIKPEPDVLEHIKTPQGDAPLFDSTVYVSVGTSVKSEQTAGLGSATRQMINTSMQFLDGTAAASSGKLGMDAATSYKNALMQLQTPDNTSDFLCYGDNGKNDEEVSVFWKNTINSVGNKMFKWPSKYKTPLELVTKNNLRFKDLSEIRLPNGKGLDEIGWADQYKNSSTSRIFKVYLQTANMQNAMNVMGVREGTEFAVWTPYIYLTYLDWFGIIGGQDPVFNEHLFKESSDLLNTKAEELFKGTFLTKEEKEAEVLEYTYMMLHPTEGREYRSNILMSWISDWIYETYNDIVYGGSVSSYSSEGTTGTRMSSGFLHLDSYADNFMTSWFMEAYGKYAIIIIGAILLAIVITGVLNQKNLAWYVVSLIVAVNIVLITPMMGEITPFIANNAVQRLFSNRMTHWAMMESIANAKIEKQTAASDDGKITKGLTTMDYIRMLNITYLDRSIMFKTDISKKITEDSSGIMADVQQLQSTRWLLPTLVRQFTASDGSANYIFQPLGDVYDNVSNMYWLYNPDDRANVTTRTSRVQSEDEPPSIDVSSKKMRYEGYTETSMAVTKNGMIETLQDNEENDYMGYTWNSVSRIKSDEELPHTGFYLLDYTGAAGTLSIPDARGNWDELAANPGVNQDLFVELANSLSQEASSYEPLKSGAKINYGYLWTTENPMHYFYQTVKDTFTSGKSLASLSADLQGVYKDSTITGQKERQTFMHFRDSGYVRDIADLQELFTNVIPYMYTVQVIAGGTDGTDGLLGDTLMNNYPLYEKNLKSWLFRCNWATKLMEDKDLTRPTTVRTLRNEKVRIENPMLPSSYPEERPMIFSEAQQNFYGLTDADLTLPELKAVQVNKAIERKWTLLINYLNTPDISTEVFYRQMATDALIEFNKEFSPDRAINSTKALYPTSLDLRSISFDSVMKMLMINSTRDASYIYGDTMKGVIESSDIFSAFLLLISAFLCAFLLPFLRNLVLGVIFYLGFWAIMCNILAGGLTKLKVSAAYLINNIVYLIVTLAYYAVYALLINTDTSESVLSVGNVSINAGPPTWQFFIIIGTSLAYIFISWKLLVFTIKNYRDLGFELYATWGNMLADKLTNGFNSIASKFGFSGISRRGASGSPVGGSAHRRRGSDIDAAPEEMTINIRDREKEEADNLTNASSGYTMDSTGYDRADTDDNFYDSEIEKGRHMH